MKNWENRLSAILLSVAGLTLAGMLVSYIWISPPGEGLTLVENSGLPSMPPAPGPLNLNTATLEELDALPGIGETLAERILTYRDEHGKFQNVEELMEVEGIGEATFAELKALITLE